MIKYHFLKLIKALFLPEDKLYFFKNHNFNVFTKYILLPLQKDKEDQWLEKKVQGNKDHIILEHLQWTMGYEVQITAANRLGYSEPTVYEFSMPPKPNIIKGKRNYVLS